MMSAWDNKDELNQQLTELVEYNRSMLQDAEAGHWEKVIEADVLRKNLFEAFYTSSGIQQLPGLVAATREMISINHSLEKLALEAKNVATTGALSINKGRRAVHAYTKNVR